jgi:hypothetical protein
MKVDLVSHYLIQVLTRPLKLTLVPRAIYGKR